MSRYTEELIRREAQLEEMRRDEQDDQNFLLGMIVIMAAVAGATFTLFIVGMAVLMMFLGTLSRGAPVSQVAMPPAAAIGATAPGATLVPTSEASPAATLATAAPDVAPLLVTPPLAADTPTIIARPPAPATEIPAEVPPIAPDAVLPPTAVPALVPNPPPFPESQPPVEQVPATAIPQPPVETLAVVPPPATPTAPLPTLAVDPFAATPTAVFTTGGLGLSRAEWEGIYGPVIDSANVVARYGDPGIYTQDVNYVDDRVQAVIWRTEQPIMVENALSVGNTYAPADGQYVTSYAPEGRPDTNVDVYTSQMLAVRLGADNKWWNGSAPGTYIVQYTRTPTGVTSVEIGTGNTPFP